MSFKFIHCSDIHLDSPLRKLARYEGAPVEALRGATRRALGNMINLAIAEKVSFILIAGDLYDGDQKDFRTALFFVNEMVRLRQAGIRVYLVSGNHDAQSQITRSLRLPDNVHSFSTVRPETKCWEEIGVAIHGQGFSKRETMDDLSAMYPCAQEGFFNIGLLHTSADGREGHASYAPCTVAGLLVKGYDYWALGHVHKREVLHEDPWVLFCGNLQGRSIRETGPKGCTLVTVENGRLMQIEEKWVDVVRWSLCKVDISGIELPEDMVRFVGSKIKQEIERSEERFLAVRILISGASPVHVELARNEEKWVNEIRAAATDASDGKVWIEKIEITTCMAVSLDEDRDRDDSLGGLLRLLENPDAVENGLSGLMKGELSEFINKLPRELREGDEAINMDDPLTRRSRLHDASQLLLSHLRHTE